MESNFVLALRLLPNATLDTLYMVFTSAFIGLFFGLALGILLFMTGKGGIAEKRRLHQVLGIFVNIGRSFPFAILIIALIPFTRWIVGTSLGTTASIVPLSIAASFYIARIVEVALQNVNPRLTEAALVMGSTPFQIVCKVLLPESLPNFIASFTVAIVTIVGYSAMAGLVGGGGLGTVAIQYGYQRFNGVLMFWTVVLLMILVIAIQWVGGKIAKKIRQKRGQS